MSLGTQCAWSVKTSLYLSLTHTTRTLFLSHASSTIKIRSGKDWFIAGTAHTREPARTDAKWRVRCNTLQHMATLEWWGPWSFNSRHGAHMRACANRHVRCNTLYTLQHTAIHCNTLQHTATHFNIGMMRTWSINSKHGAHARACAKRREMARSLLPTTALSSSVPCTAHSNRGVGSVLDVRMRASLRLGGWLTKGAFWRVRCCLQQHCAARCLVLRSWFGAFG